jgi:signal transduction histidine kinase
MSLALSRSLRGRLLLLVSLVAASLALLAGLLVWQAYQNERDAIHNELGNTARATASLVDQRVENMEALLAGLVAPGELDRDDLAGFATRARRATKPGRRWFVVSRLDGKQLVNTAAAPGAELPMVPVQEGELATIAAGRSYVSNVFQGPVAKGPVFYVSMGVPAGDRPRYRVALAVSPVEFAEGTFISSAPKSSVFTVIDRAGLILARNTSPESFVGRPPTPDIAAASRLGGETFLRSRTLEGRDVLGVVVPVPRLGWSIAAGAPRAALEASIWRLISTGLATGLVILLAATGVAWWISRAALRDVAGLLADTRRIASGETPPPSTAELAETSAIAASLRASHRKLQDELHERSQAEAALARAKVELEQKVAERTASLSDLLRQMEDFNYSVSHDLRAPLRSIIGFTRVVLQEHAAALDDEAREYLRRVAASGERMDRLIEDLLALSRVSQEELTLGPISLGRLVHGCVREHPLLADQSARIEIVEPLPTVLGHASPLQQAVINLLLNALKFIRPNVEPRVRVQAERRGDHVRLWIEDNGIGIEPAHQHRLFSIFHRLHPEKRFAGTGIGLAIVRRAVERLGGRVGVESDGVNGSRFWMDLRLADDAPRPG